MLQLSVAEAEPLGSFAAKRSSPPRHLLRDNVCFAHARDMSALKARPLSLSHLAKHANDAAVGCVIFRNSSEKDVIGRTFRHASSGRDRAVRVPRRSKYKTDGLANPGTESIRVLGPSSYARGVPCFDNYIPRSLGLVRRHRCLSGSSTGDPREMSGSIRPPDHEGREGRMVHHQSSRREMVICSYTHARII